MRLQRLLAVVRADVMIRLRRPLTAVVFVLLSFVPYLWIPDPSTGRALMQVTGHRAIYNSAAIGMASALLGTVFIGLAGFYVVSNALRRDVISRCGYVIASTTMRGSEYIAGKFLGNVAFLSLFTLGYMTTAMAMVLVRGEAPLQPLVFAQQYALLLPPAIAFVSAIAILFECTPLLRTKFGDVFYFILWSALTTVAVVMLEQGVSTKWAALFDISGLGFVLQQMKTYYHTTSLTIGAAAFDATKAPVIFPGLRTSGEWLLPRVVAMLWPLVLLVVARLFFHRFDPARVRAMPNEGTRRSWIGRFNLLAKPLARLLVRGGDALTSAPAIPAFLRSAISDALASIAAFPLAAIAIAALAIASLVTPTQGFFIAVLPIAFVACALAVADIACREQRAGTTALVFAAPHLRARFVLWKFASAMFVAIAFLFVPLVRALLARPSSAPQLLIGMLFVAAAATALGVVSANPKTFTVAFLTFWYINVNDKGATPSLDFAGWFDRATPLIGASYFVVTLALLMTAHLFHSWQLSRRW